MNRWPYGIKKHIYWLYWKPAIRYLLGGRVLFTIVKSEALVHFFSNWMDSKRKDRHSLVIWYLGSRVEDQSPMKSKSNTFNELFPYPVFQQLFGIHLSAQQRAINGSEEKPARSPEERTCSGALSTSFLKDWASFPSCPSEILLRRTELSGPSPL